MKKEFLLGAALVMLLGGAGIYFYVQPITTIVAGQRVTTITYTADGFSPQDITIHRGDALLFVNNGTRPFWPASGVHPTHAEYPVKLANDCLGSAFDACRAIPSGGSWQFTFDAIGTWDYHDHLDAGNIGFITVTP